MDRWRTGLVALFLGAAAATAQQRSPRDQAVADVLAAFKANDQAALKALARRDRPDPWQVADKLARNGELDAALAFASAAPRKATERLPEYLRKADKAGIEPGAIEARRLVDRSRNRNEDDEVVAAALEAWGLIHDPGTHGVLLKYIKVPSRKKERRELAVTAAQALACYRTEKGYRRYTLIRELMQAFGQIYGAAMGAVWPSAAATNRFGAVAPEMVASFNALTDAKCASYSECVQWWRKNRRRIKAGKPVKG